jgi:putative nucleotidyltransferase with HDIG domain
MKRPRLASSPPGECLVSQVAVAESVDRKRVLFADEEIGSLRDLQRMLQPMRREWEMIFATSGTMALQILEESPCDVLVTAARLSDLVDGSLLAAVAVQHPQMIRIALCERADREALVRTAGLAHQQLAKPCDPALITSQIRRTLALQHLLTNAALQTVVAQIGTLPTLPSLYLELTAELKAEEPSPERVARIIASDPAMNAKIIQMANSPFWGLRTTITQPREAVLFLGLGTISALVLSIHVFSCFDARRLASCKLSDFWAHSTMVSGYTRGIARFEKCDPSLVGEATIAGLLHDLGKLVLANSLPAFYLESMKVAATENLPAWQAEQKVIGASHAEIGAYLLALWGLPQRVVEAVAWHHRPSDSRVFTGKTIAMVHAANAIAHQQRILSKHNGVAVPKLDWSAIDWPYLEALDLTDRFEQWVSQCWANA